MTNHVPLDGLEERFLQTLLEPIASLLAWARTRGRDPGDLALTITDDSQVARFEDHLVGLRFCYGRAGPLNVRLHQRATVGQRVAEHCGACLASFEFEAALGLPVHVALAERQYTGALTLPGWIAPLAAVPTKGGAA